MKTKLKVGQVQARCDEHGAKATEDITLVSRAPQEGDDFRYAHLTLRIEDPALFGKFKQGGEVELTLGECVAPKPPENK